MQLRIIIQLNKATLQKNVIITRDMLAPVEDFLIAWPESTVYDSVVLLLAMGDDTILEGLFDTELRSELDPLVDKEVLISPEVEARCRALLEGV